MFNWFKKQETVPRIQVLEREASELRLAEWRSDPNLTKEAAKILAGSFVKIMLDVLENEHPGAFVMLRGDQNDRAVQQARAEGYTMCLSNLKALGKHEKPHKELGEATFGTEEEAAGREE